MKMYKMEDGSYINLERIEKLKIRDVTYEPMAGTFMKRSDIVAIFYAGETYNDTIIDSTILQHTDTYQISTYPPNLSKDKEMRIKYDEAREKLEAWLDNFVKEYMSEKK